MIYRRYFAKPNLRNNLRNMLSDLTSEEWDPVSESYESITSHIPLSQQFRRG